MDSSLLGKRNSPRLDHDMLLRAGRWIRNGVVGAIAVAAVAILWPGGMVPYLLEQGWFQAELLAGRVPIDEDDPRYSEAARERFAWIRALKAHGAKIGLASSENYGTINPDWKRSVWNLSACDPVSFTPASWWFPIVGRMPYLGYFRQHDAMTSAAALRAEGYDVYVRTAGAYSTTGWFADPVLPDMLGWSEPQLADTLLHELTHATVWLPGSAEFNESFANFVGQQASLGYLIEKYGADSREVGDVRAARADSDRFFALLAVVYAELDAVYADGALSRSDKLARKRAIFAALPVRVADLELARPERWSRWVRTGTWNNARMMQFRTYNRGMDQFACVYAAEQSDIGWFIARIEEITADGRDPYVALAEAASKCSDLR